MGLISELRREATFSSLPTHAKHAIIHQLHFEDLRNCRLVSKEWFHIVNSCQTYQLRFHLRLSDQNWAWTTELLSSFNEDAAFAARASQAERHVEMQGSDSDIDDEDDTLQQVVLPTPCINHLTISSLAEPLPIYSASRSRVPKSKVLSLHAGITHDNLVRLLYYQAPSARQLFLHDLSLLHFNLNGQFLDPNRRWTILVRLSFVFWYEINKSTFLDFTKHVLALGQLLVVIDTPKLRTVIASIDFPKQQEAYHGRAKVQFMEHLSRKFNQNFATFVTKWGHKLSRFYFTVRGINALPVLKTFDHLENVRCLKFCLLENDSGLQESDIVHSLQAFTRLTTLLISLPQEFDTVTLKMLLQNNKHVLSMLKVQHWVTSLEWIFAPFQTRTDKNLQYMELRWKIQDPGSVEDLMMELMFDEKNLIPYYSMRRLKLFLHLDHARETGGGGESKLLNANFSSHLAIYISQCMPNLSHIELVSTNTLITDLIDVPQLISGLNYARRVHVHDRWKKLHKKIPLYELERWCEETKDIQGTWMNDYSYYRISINTFNEVKDYVEN